MAEEGLWLSSRAGRDYRRLSAQPQGRMWPASTPPLSPLMRCACAQLAPGVHRSGRQAPAAAGARVTRAAGAEKGGEGRRRHGWRRQEGYRVAAASAAERKVRSTRGCRAWGAQWCPAVWPGSLSGAQPYGPSNQRTKRYSASRTALIAPALRLLRAQP